MGQTGSNHEQNGRCKWLWINSQPRVVIHIQPPASPGPKIRQCKSPRATMQIRFTETHPPTISWTTINSSNRGGSRKTHSKHRAGLQQGNRFAELWVLSPGLVFAPNHILPDMYMEGSSNHL